jgi:chromosome segregation ATPase
VATKKGNGHDPGTARIVEVLERIEKEAHATNVRLDATNVRLDATNARLDALREEMSGLREELHGFRVETHDELLDLHAEQHQLRMELKTSIEVRLARLEAAVFRPTGT